MFEDSWKNLVRFCLGLCTWVAVCSVDCLLTPMLGIAWLTGSIRATEIGVVLRGSRGLVVARSRFFAYVIIVWILLF